jgi:hypothetical protein
MVPTMEAPHIEIVEAAGTQVRVPVPHGWEVLDALPSVPFIARERATEEFRSNVTVAVDAGGYPAMAPDAGAFLAAGLPSGVLVSALAHPDDAAEHLLVVVHAAATAEVVTVQRQLRRGERTIAVSYTCSVERYPKVGQQLEQLAVAVGASPERRR